MGVQRRKMVYKYTIGSQPAAKRIPIGLLRERAKGNIPYTTPDNEVSIYSLVQNNTIMVYN